MKEVQITKVEPVAGATVQKCYTVRGAGFGLAVTHHLADGSTIVGRADATRKKDVPGALARMQRAALAGAMCANYSDDGSYWGTVTKYTIGVGGLVPEARESEEGT